MLEQVGNIDAVRVVKGCKCILNPYQLSAIFLKEFCSPVTYVPKSLNDESFSLKSFSLALNSKFDTQVHPKSGSSVTTFKSSGTYWFSCNHVIVLGMLRMSCCRHISVRDPCHGLSVGIHIRSRNIVLWPDVLS